MARPLERADLEQPGRHLTLSFDGVDDNEEAARIYESVAALLTDLTTPRGGGATVDGDADAGGRLLLAHLRLILFAADLRSAVFHWQRQLGLPEDLTHTEEGVSVGKTLMWGDGQPGSTFAVVLLDLDIGRGLVSGKPLARSIVAHELAHVHLGLLLRYLLGPDVKDAVEGTDWPLLRRQLAVNCFDEFHAEYVASDYIDDAGVQSSVDLLVSVASAVNLRVRERVAAYRHRGDHGPLWGFTVSEVAHVTNQLGRVLGLLRGKELPTKAVADLEALSPALPRHVAEMRDACAGIMGLPYKALTWEVFAPAEAIVEQVFETFGVIPRCHGDGMGLEVPWRPGEQERADRERAAQRLGGRRG